MKEVMLVSGDPMQVRDWLRVIASNKDRNVYELRYFNIADNEGEDEE